MVSTPVYFLYPLFAKEGDLSSYPYCLIQEHYTLKNWIGKFQGFTRSKEIQLLFSYDEALAKVLFCHSRVSNRESSFFKKQRLLDTRFHGYDGTGLFAGTFARASRCKGIYEIFGRPTVRV